ncbi:IclR family transcriptional regulator [Paracoccus sp. (in: a-proteobacteria)]|uniref:IclR family transcriptional regulator n=1 Tax=Paracoccus sp. TaxID=267 RepID=UPI0026E0987B|nr:IclR family transcriptional regulator [Paracoccus sp. (in: a-proteobacteria)]MDO5648258.1 IclR family transcriptional regulator [Paracoccus sp. (in: a-proteobacteria)]
MTIARRDNQDGTVGRALSVLDLVADFGRPVRFSELLARADLPKATLHRFLHSLTNQGMLTFDADRQTYAPGLRLVRLAHAAWAQSSLAPIACRVLDQLAWDTGHTVHLAQLDYGAVIYVDKRNAAQPVDMFAQSGKIGPAYCTGVGKAMLAFLPDDAQAQAMAQQAFFPHTPQTLTTPDALRADLARVRARGFAVDQQEHEPGIICLAAPIRSGQGRVIGAVSVTAQGDDAAALIPLAPVVMDAARDIADLAATWRFPEMPQPDPRSLR